MRPVSGPGTMRGNKNKERQWLEKQKVVVAEQIEIGVPTKAIIARRCGQGSARQGSGKGSCAPKLFMLLMPFAALGTYLVLRS